MISFMTCSTNKCKFIPSYPIAFALGLLASVLVSMLQKFNCHAWTPLVALGIATLCIVNWASINARSIKHMIDEGLMKGMRRIFFPDKVWMRWYVEEAGKRLVFYFCGVVLSHLALHFMGFV